MKELHDALINKNVILFFKGAFNQALLLNLLSIIENQLKVSNISIKIYNLMVEMLQNISQNADNLPDEKNLKSGIFLIAETDDEYILISGNYILNSKIQIFEKSLSLVNELSHDKLMVEYNNILHGINTENNEMIIVNPEGCDYARHVGFVS